MTDEIKQPATETTDTGATPPAEATGAPETKTDDLDALLEQYRRETGSTEQPQSKPAASEPPAAIEALRSQVAALEQQVASERMGKELDELAKGVRAAGDLPDYLSDDDIIGILDRRAALDPALAKAWVDSRTSPRSRSALIKALGTELGKKFAKARGVDEQATADREAVAASVRGNNKAPEGKAPDYAKLSDNEFRKECEKLGITF